MLSSIDSTDNYEKHVIIFPQKIPVGLFGNKFLRNRANNLLLESSKLSLWHGDNFDQSLCNLWTHRDKLLPALLFERFEKRLFIR